MKGGEIVNGGEDRDARAEGVGEGRFLRTARIGVEWGKLGNVGMRGV